MKDPTKPGEFLAKILNLVYRVRSIPEYECSGAMGSFCSDGRRIFVHAGETAWSDLLHELVHAGFFALGIPQEEHDEENERKVRAVEGIIGAILMDNRELAHNMVDGLADQLEGCCANREPDSE